jgi:DNA-binding MarR family transcriptional regulator
MLLARKISNLRNTILEPYQLSSVEWFVMGIVLNKSTNGGIRITDLATLFDVKTTYITAIVNKLKALDYVNAVVDNSDARVRLVVITKKGSKAADAIEVKIQAAAEKMLGDRVSAEQLVHFFEVLHEIAYDDPIEAESAA